MTPIPNDSSPESKLQAGGNPGLPILVAITGASGSIYGLRLVSELLQSGRPVHLVASEWGSKVIAIETGRDLATWMDDWRQQELPGRLENHQADNLAAAVASGSCQLAASVVLPCSAASLGAMASGAGRNLVHRAAAVALKEGWPLVLAPRESPLSLIDLRNLTTLAEAGAIIMPASPGFYHQPQTMDDLVDHVVGKVLDRLGVEHQLFRRWDGQ